MIISLRKLNNKSDISELRRPRTLLGTSQILNLLYAMGTPQYGKAMGKLWGGHGEAMESYGEASRYYLCIVLGYKLAMGWLWAGYGLAMGRLWEAMYVLI